MKERESEMEQVTAVGKGTTFFLLLVLAASASATSLNTTQQNTAITAASGTQVCGVGVCISMCACGERIQYTPFNRILSFYRKRPFRPFP